MKRRGGIPGSVYGVRAGMFRATDFYPAIMEQGCFYRVIRELGIEPNPYGMYQEEQARTIIWHYHGTNNPQLKHRKF